MSPSNLTHLPVDGPVIVVDAYNQLIQGVCISAFQSTAYAQVLAKRHSLDYQETWVYVSVMMTNHTRWFKHSYFYNGKLDTRYKSPKDTTTWEQIIYEWEQITGKTDNKLKARVAGTGT